jgi:uncharacterized membrane protein
MAAGPAATLTFAVMNEPDPPPTVPGALLALIVCAVLFIWWTGRELPDVVASHFNGAGEANGHMSRGPYLTIMLLITALVPLLMVVIPSRALRAADARINVPNRSYWLAPERRAETIRFLSRQMATCAALVIVFLCYVQWLVVKANAHTPPAMNQSAFMVGLAVFLGCTCSWVLRVLRRFARRS